MTLSDLGNLGDFIGGIAVIATLVYLARQIRENSRVARIQTSQAIRGVSAQLRMTALQADGVAELMAKAFEDHTDLTTAERIRFNLMCAAIFDNLEQSFQASKAGLAEHTGSEHLIRSYLSQDAVLQWWAEGRKMLDPSFVAHVEQQILQGMDKVPLHFLVGREPVA